MLACGAIHVALRKHFLVSLSMQIFLIGFMGSGKTQTGKQLSDLIGKPFVDLDAYIEKKGGQSIATLFKYGGADHFRKLEKKALQEVITDFPDHIIATGGGTPIYFDNLETMKANGMVIFLDALPEIIFQRIKDSGEQRPLLKTMKGEELKQYISKLLTERMEYYLQAHLAVEVLEEDFNCALEIAGYLRKISGQQLKS